MTLAAVRGDLSQRIFDALMRTISEPGTIRTLPAEHLDPTVATLAWLAIATADVGVSIAANVGARADTEPDITRLVADATGATVTDLASAAIVMLAQPQAHELDELCVGSALEPELAARVAIAVDALATIGEGDFDEVVLTGPGVPGCRTLAIKGVDRSVLARLGRASGDFPTGIDTWLFAPSGEVACIPRSTQVVLKPKES